MRQDLGPSLVGGQLLRGMDQTRRKRATPVSTRSAQPARPCVLAMRSLVWRPWCVRWAIYATGLRTGEVVALRNEHIESGCRA